MSDLDGIIAALVNPTDAWSADWCGSAYPVPVYTPPDFSALGDAIRALGESIAKMLPIWQALIIRMSRPSSPLMARYRRKRRMR